MVSFIPLSQLLVSYDIYFQSIWISSDSAEYK